MDEPLSNLDAALRVHMRREIVELHRRSGVVTLYVTHDQEEALGMADRVAVMLNGRILQTASPAEIYRQPDHIDVAAFIGSPRINLIPAEVDAAGHLSSGGRLLAVGARAPAGPITLGIRPEGLRLGADPVERGAPFKIDRLEFLGAEVLVHGRADGVVEPLIARLAPASASELVARSSVYVSIDVAALLIFDASGRRLHGSLPGSEVTSHAA
jgi:multiple sugar transport system ATP-binding protein